MIARTRLDDPAERAGFAEARRLLLAAAAPLGAETIALEHAYGRIVAHDLHAAEDIVPYARSAMDGYAVRACDTAAASSTAIVTLRVVGSVYAGESSVVPAPATPAVAVAARDDAAVPGMGRGAVAAGNAVAGTANTAVAIATGAPLPAGFDAVVPVEDVDRVGDTIVLTAPVGAGEHVFEPGDDAKCGDVLVRAGDVVTPGRAALLAAAGHAQIGVYRRPRVAVVCTGDELVPVTERPGVGQVRNSNATMLAALLAGDGADVVMASGAADRGGALRGVLERALGACDLLITTGGASVGGHDLVKGTLASLGARFAFRSVALRPAKPTAFARVGSTLVAVLPGNPAAAFAGYAALVRGVVRRLAGQRVAFPQPMPVTLRGTVHGKADRHFLMFGRVERDGASFSVIPLADQCSSLVRTSADANALIVVPPGAGNLGPGTTVMVEMLDWNA